MEKDVSHTHNGILLNQKKNGIMLFAAMWMQLEIIMLNKPERERHIPYNFNVESKIWHKRTYLQNRNRSTDRQQMYRCQGGVGGGGRVQELVISM